MTTQTIWDAYRGYIETETDALDKIYPPPAKPVVKDETEEERNERFWRALEDAANS